MFKTERICQHKRKYSKKDINFALVDGTKKTDCPSKLTLTIHKYYEKSKSKIPITRTHRCVLKLVWNHNHPLSSAHTLSFRPIAQDTMEKYNHYFQLGHSASSARHYHIQQLQIENEECKVQQILADRSINPSESDVHRAFRAWREKNYGKDNGQEMFDKLEELVDRKHCVNGGKAFLQRYISANCNDNAAEQPLVLAIVTPLMARTHAHIPQAKDIAFVDSTASLDRFSSPMFIMSTASSAGGIPLGVVITVQGWAIGGIVAIVGRQREKESARGRNSFRQGQG